MKYWAVALNGGSFNSLGIGWLQHAQKFPDIKLLVVDTGLEVQQRRKLTENGVDILSSTSRSHLDIWGDLLAKVDGVLLYSTASVFDPIVFLSNGEDKMVFDRWSSHSEYYNLCRPIISIESQARAANCIEDDVAKRFGGICNPAKICGPVYLWKAMVGFANFVRGSQPFSVNETWEPLAANLFALLYPEYTTII